MLFDVGRRYPRGYIHRQKQHTRPIGFGQQGPAEMHYLLNTVSTMVKGRSAEVSSFEVNDPWGSTSSHVNKIIYSEYPHLTADNHFSGSHVLDLAGKMGFGLTMTTRRDRFPKGLKPFLHHDKTKPGDLRAKAMRCENPIVAICQVIATSETKAYTKTHVSFQSTGATNISGVNNLPSCGLYVTQRQRGRGVNKRVWGIEQNEGRATYLSQYFAVNNVDHMISIAMIRYICWKYWHSPYLHALSIAVVACFDMYVECTEGELDPDWYINKKSRMSFRAFRLLLSEQMLKYTPKDNKLPGDECFRAWSRRTKRQRDKSCTSSDSSSFCVTGVNVENYKRAKMSSRRNTTRLCGDLHDIKLHFASLTKTGNTMRCEVCGEPTAIKCGLCNKYMCLYKKRKFLGGQCALTYHEDSFFGLSKSDATDLFGMQKSEWVPPSTNKIKCNARHIETIKEALRENIH